MGSGGVGIETADGFAKLRNGPPELAGQGRQRRAARGPRTALPLRDSRLVHTHGLAELGLSQLLRVTGGADEFG